MISTSQGVIPSPFRIGGGVVGVDSVARSAFTAEEIREQIGLAPSLPTVKISSGDKRFKVEPNRTVYTIDNDLAAASGTLELVNGADDAALIIIQVADELRTITVADGGEMIEDEEEGLFIIPGGDLKLHVGDAIAFSFNATLGRWIEAGRVWASETFVSSAAVSDTALLGHGHDQFVHVDGSRPLTGDWDNTGRRIRNTGVAEVSDSAPTPVKGGVWLDTSATGTGGTGLLSRITIMADLTLTVSHEFVLADASAGPIVVTLPPASANGGRSYHIKKDDPSPHPVTIDGDGDDTIDDGVTAVLTVEDEAIRICADSVEKNWDILAA